MAELEIREGDKEKIRELLEREIDQKLSEIAQFIFSESQKNIVANNSIGVTGNLLGKVTLDLHTPLHKTITYEAPYADFVEYGTLPHNLPPGVLDEWAAKKFGLPPDEAKRVAFLVARKIATEGMTAHPFVRPAIAKAREKFGSE